MKSLGNYFPLQRVFLTKEVIFIAHFLINATQLRVNSGSTPGQLRVNFYKTSASKRPSVPLSLPPSRGKMGKWLENGGTRIFARTKNYSSMKK
jgi:hypothetical protein